jgi:asparagine synthase (glutamine-hydrolysing)
MCGIAGVYDPELRYPMDERTITAMADAISHRGPDEFSCHMEDNLAFGLRRLSIVDLLNGHQPFFGANGDVVLICNGEIYNYKELRYDLESRGCRFETNCDVEVIVHLYCEYGKDFLKNLNGQFAFAIYDKRNETLFLARDQFGICPLFFTFVEGVFIFASEIKAIIKHPLVKREVDLEGLDQIFTFPGLVSPVTLFKNISSLAPGHFMIVREGRADVFQYWDLIYPEVSDTPSLPESFYVDKLEELLLKSIRYRLNADVPVGFYLSGGLDSSLIGAMMKKVDPARSYPSFSIGFPSDGQMNERTYQRKVIDHLNLTNTEIMFDSAEVEKGLKQAVWASESSLKESYNTCSLALSRSVNDQGIKVILSGEGADELFGGYVGYRFDKQRTNQQLFKDMADQLEDDYRMRLWGDPDFFYEKNYYEFAGIRKNLYSGKIRAKFREFDAVRKLAFNKERVRNRHVLHKRSYIDLKLRLSDHLIADHCDRVTYSHSVEGRFPFLDIELVDFIRTMPAEIKLNGLTEKYILKKLARKYIPDTIVDRQKFGFVAPGSPSILSKNIEWINDLLSYETIKRQGYFDPDVIEYLKKSYRKDGFRLNLPFESDLLIVVLTFNIFLELFGMPDNS